MSTQIVPDNLTDLVRAQATHRPGAVAITFEGRHTTYAELDRHSNQVANGLRSIVSSPETRVALLAKNTDIFSELWLGAIKARDVLVPINWRLAPPEVRYIVNDAKAAVLFVDRTSFRSSSRRCPRCPRSSR